MSAIFDEREALERVGGDRELLREVAGIFLTDAPEMIDAITQAIAERDPAAVFRTAHKLKGSVANFSAHRAIAAALSLERIGARGTLEGAEEAFLALQKEIELARQALAEFVAADSDGEIENGSETQREEPGR